MTKPFRIVVDFARKFFCEFPASSILPGTDPLAFYRSNEPQRLKWPIETYREQQQYYLQLHMEWLKKLDRIQREKLDLDLELNRGTCQ